MKRKIIKIDTEKCIGCGKCARACHEGAIDMVNGKAHLARENFCDGFGDCLPACPADAIHFEEREAPAYDENAVQEAKNKKLNKGNSLQYWPIQLKLAPVSGENYKNANLLIAADCTCFAYGRFHEEFMKDKTVLIGCPKLDREDYSDKLSQIFRYNDIQSITLVVMEVPCCSRMQQFVEDAISLSMKNIPMQVKTLTLEGEIK